MEKQTNRFREAGIIGSIILIFKIQKKIQKNSEFFLFFFFYYLFPISPRVSIWQTTCAGPTNINAIPKAAYQHDAPVLAVTTSKVRNKKEKIIFFFFPSAFDFLPSLSFIFLFSLIFFFHFIFLLIFTKILFPILSDYF